MIDVMKHKLVGGRYVLKSIGTAAARKIEDDLSRSVGEAIAARYPANRESLVAGEKLTLTVFVFSPAELAQLIADVRDKAIEETMALADTLIDTPQES